MGMQSNNAGHWLVDAPLSRMNGRWNWIATDFLFRKGNFIIREVDSYGQMFSAATKG